MINKLIEKYKEIVRASNETVEEQRQQRFPDEITIQSEITRFCVYETVIQDLEKLEEPTICGHSIEEVITILNGLEIERITDIKMTMGNLSILAEKLQEDFNKNLKKSFELATKQFRD